jgi:hypothetical protein
MMKKEITLSNSNLVADAMQSLINKVKQPIEGLRKYYSDVLEREITMHQTLLLLNAQVAFVFAAFPVGGPISLRALCCAWFLHAVLKCKRAL